MAGGFGNHEFDVFISYASEDREFVRGLAEELRDHGIRVWYDEFALQVGDSLAGKIDEGLARSQFGVVVVSDDFLKKKWPQKELNTLLSLHVAERATILPVLHGLTFEELQTRKPMLADLLALNSNRGIAPILGAITKRLLASRNSLKPLIESYQAIFTATPAQEPEHYCQTIHVNGIFRVAPGSELVYRDIVTTSSPFGRLEYFNAVPQPTEGLGEQRERSGARFMHFELKGRPGETTMQISAVLQLVKKMTPDDGYVALRLPYDTKFLSMVFDYSGLEFDPGRFAAHVDRQSADALQSTSKPIVHHWPDKRMIVAHSEGFSAGSNPMIGWGRWVAEWGKG